MRWLLALALAACGGDFQSPGPPDGTITRDLTAVVTNIPDLSCFNTACGGCSSWARPDGTPAQSGDACLFAGTFACSGQNLACSSSACPTCASTMRGTICGADGQTIITLADDGSGGCVAIDTGSAIAVCNQTAGDACRNRCTNVGGRFECTAWCTSTPDAGTGGCGFSSSATCASLAGCP